MRGHHCLDICTAQKVEMEGAKPTVSSKTELLVGTSHPWKCWKRLNGAWSDMFCWKVALPMEGN